MISVILLAGGKGLRMGHSTPKQFIPLLGKPVVFYSLELFLSLPSISEIVVVAPPSFHNLFANFPVTLAPPGPRRQDSVFSGAKALSSKSQYVLIHDAARPLTTPASVEALIQSGKEHKAATLAVPMKSTIKQGDEQGFVQKTLNRSSLWDIQTPQFITRMLLQKGEELTEKLKLEVTDDVSLAELQKHPVKLVVGEYSNIKLTTPEDIPLAEKFLQAYAAV